MSRRRWLCWAVIASVGVLWLALRLMHPDMTDLRLGLMFWPFWLVTMVGVGFALIVLDRSRQ